MANVTVDSVGSNSIVVNLNDYTINPKIDDNRISFDNRDIVEIEQSKDDLYITIMMRDAHGRRKWEVTHDRDYSGEQYFIIDTIDGIQPSSNADLFDKLTALRG